MKNLKLNLLLIAAATIVLNSCGGLSKMVENSNTVKYQVVPSPLETHGGQVDVTMTVTFPEKYFNKKATVTATPVLKYEGGQTEFEATILQGESVEANNKVIPYAGGNYTYTGKIPYKAEMLKSQLVVEMSAQIGDKTPVEIPGIPVAIGVIATPTLVQITPQAIMMGDKYQRISPESYNAQILYVINKYDVRKTELSKAEVAELNKKIEEAQANERIQLKGAKISAYASPDGEVDLNTKLSENRGKSAENYLKQTMKKLKVTEAESAEFLKVVSTAEDWDGFKTAMEASNIKDKELILRVLSMHSNPAVREKEIKNIAAAYNEIAETILPELRRSQMIIDVEKVGYSDEELVALTQSNIDTLNLEELLYAATLIADNSAKLAVYQKAAQKYPDCVRAHNNVGYVQIQLGNVAEAKAAFEAAKAIKEIDVVKNNLGVIAMLEGDMATAEQLFTSAMGAGDAVNANLGIIKIQQGDYKAAVSYLGNQVSFNSALAQLLNGETEKAQNTIGQVEGEVAINYYLKAVAGARAGREEEVINNLRRAIELDGAWKAYAIKDAEFSKFVASEGFAALVK